MPEGTSFVRANSRVRAKFVTWRSANEVGFNVEFGDLVAHRRPMLDKESAILPDLPYSLDFVRSLFSIESQINDLAEDVST